MILIQLVVRAAKCKIIVSLYLLGAAYGNSDYIRSQDVSTNYSEPSLNYRTTRGKAELEYDLHSVYTLHSAL